MKYEKPDKQEMAAWIDELTKENERLRAALIEIRDACFGGSPAVDGEAWIYERAKKEVGQG